MMLTAERTNDATLAQTAVNQILIASETLRDGGHAPWAAMFRLQLGKAQAIHDRLKAR